MSPSTSTRRPSAASKSLADQYKPIVAIHDTVRKRAQASLDVDDARARVRTGRAAFDTVDVLRGARDLGRTYERVAAAFEHTGIVSTSQFASLQQSPREAERLILSWAHGDAMPRNQSLRLARTVAGIVGNAILAAASDDVVSGFSLSTWKRVSCPCCGASPDLALATDTRRTLVCWRCDTMWRTAERGCLGCGADTAPTLARVPSPYLGYELTICNSCGRYLKERRGAPTHALIVERALTAGLDEAAQQRGLRL